MGHFARFCPTSEKQCRIRERRASLPAFNYTEWPFGDVINFAVPALAEPYYLVRPEYSESDSPTSFESVNPDEIMSDCASVNYVIEDDDGPSVLMNEPESGNADCVFKEFNEKEKFKFASITEKPNK